MLNFDKELSNFDIENICAKLEIPLNGIYMRDTLPEKLYKGNYILNLDSSEGNGTHWTCFIKEGRNIYYLDSFGLPPPQDQVNRFHKRQDHVLYNDEQIQDIKSVVCGFYCIAFFLFVKTKKGILKDKIKEFANSFTDNPRSNDKLIEIFIKRHYKK